MLEKKKLQLHVVYTNKVVTIIALDQIGTYMMKLHKVTFTLYLFSNKDGANCKFWMVIIGTSRSDIYIVFDLLLLFTF